MLSIQPASGGTLAFYLVAEIYRTVPVGDLAMNDEHKYAPCMQAMNEQVKSAFLMLIPQDHEAVKSIQAELYGHLTPATLGIMSRALTPITLRRLKNDINDWLNEEFSYVECEWDEHYAKSQKERLFRQLSGNR
ncbi:hypothetical protein [Escherichia coli]|uniref:hypothetical protein n=1 Tax=Escherichia coli TaxID=562 RepID=UPI001E3501D8|nr:hypothetical protein [Escherichia coli]